MLLRAIAVVQVAEPSRWTLKPRSSAAVSRTVVCIMHLSACYSV